MSGIVWDSGASGASIPNCNQGVQCTDIIFGGTPLQSDGTVYYWRIQYFDELGIAGDWSENTPVTSTFEMSQGGGSNWHKEI